jgi:hypothetical protein
MKLLESETDVTYYLDKGATGLDQDAILCFFKNSVFLRHDGGYIPI